MIKMTKGEAKMRAELIKVLKRLTKDQQYDIAVSLAANIGYKLVEKPVDPNERLQQLYDIMLNEKLSEFGKFLAKHGGVT